MKVCLCHNLQVLFGFTVVLFGLIVSLFGLIFVLFGLTVVLFGLTVRLSSPPNCFASKSLSSNAFCYAGALAHTNRID
jgi:hypothetical protein